MCDKMGQQLQLFLQGLREVADGMREELMTKIV